MSTPRFVIAKFAPDLNRMEPKNIGVFVWFKGEFVAKFVDAKDTKYLGVDSPETYQRWITFWNRLIAQPTISPRRGRPIAKSDPSCIDALLSTQKGNFILVDAGELISAPKKSELSSVAEYLYDDLVATRKQRDRKAKENFTTLCERALDRAGIEYKTHVPIECTWGGVTRTLHPDYYVGNGSPNAILQRAIVSSEKSVNSSAMLVYSLLNQAVVEPNRCRVLIRAADVRSQSAENAVKLFDRLCGTLDVESDSAIDDIAALSAISTA